MKETHLSFWPTLTRPRIKARDIVLTLADYVQVGASISPRFTIECLQRVAISKKQRRRMKQLCFAGYRDSLRRGQDRAASEYRAVQTFLSSRL